MQELGRGALAGAGGRYEAAPGEYFGDGETLAPGVEDFELVEDPFLQGDGALAALALQGGDAVPVRAILDFPVQGHDGGLLALEMPVRVQQVIDGRHEAFDAVAAAGQA